MGDDGDFQCGDLCIPADPFTFINWLLQNACLAGEHEIKTIETEFLVIS